jgi:type VI secretion system protein VasG
MLMVEPRALLKKLSPICTQAFEGAAARCISARHYEVTVEHALLALLDLDQSDIRVVLAHYGIDVEIVRATVSRYVGELRSGNAGKPVFSSLLFEWVQDAWLYSATELDAGSVRSGALLVRLCQASSRYLPFELTALQAVDREEIRKDLMILAARSGEAMSAANREPTGAARSDDGSGKGGPLDRFTQDLTERAKQNKIDPVFGRERELRSMIEILVRRRKNNPIIVGEPGVGKTAVVEGLAIRIAEGTVPDQLKGTKLLSLDLGALQAGAGVRGEFENRLKGVIEAVKSSAQPIILFIDEAHTLIGAGGQQGGGDAANLLKPALARGELRTIAATTFSEFKRYFEKDAALERRFQPVKVEEPDVETAVMMMRGLRERFEEAHGIILRDEAVSAAATLSARYISGRQLPDKAVDLLDTAAASVNLLRNAPPAELEELKAQLASVQRHLAGLERDYASGHHIDTHARDASLARKTELEAQVVEIETRLASQRALVARIDEVRKENKGDREALRKALDELDAIPSDQRLVAADVDEASVASVVANWTGVPVGKMVKDDVSAILQLEDRIRKRVRGQDGALAVLGRELRAARSGLKPPQTPLGVFLLVGPSGVGKTETALSLADLMFGGERFVVTVNMSEFQERHTVSRLIGSPPGYVGYGEGGVLTEAVRYRPYSVVLLDEVEKADRDVMNLFYQVFDKGVLSDGEGRVIDFKNTVVILTSNLATDLLTEAAPPDQPVPDLETLTELVKPTLSAHFKPALLARMTVVPYVPIRAEALKEIVRMKTSAIVSRAKASHDVTLSVAEAVIDAIADRCREVESGARNVDHILRNTVMPRVSNQILQALSEGRELTSLALVVVDGDIQCVAGEGASS